MEVTSSKPKKQRKWHYTKPLHLQQKEFAMHLSKDLKKSIGKRSLDGRKGDTVKVMRGNEKFVGKQGVITAILRQKKQVLIEGITRKRLDGTEIQVPFKASNLRIVNIEDKDNRRLKGKKVAKEAKKVLPKVDAQPTAATVEEKVKEDGK
ncbi:MAG: 50S ribosomal protein L24 [Candidatus Diapherotrites archaeon]|uniref:Large ribosomal subunit protein uL24 n=1 Tax=Candidatus Iainarchaeum sp. TaxID=3101447 RepID=A0A2D6LP97_9ARCH|nr:50S ribosomal protein L24 [Candidatus Diapherotrites archaeon]|tara:strand:+ start:1353 stop:1802 length:450 start_codon:yes stop_codon:yes gene_type:complete